MFGTKVSPLPTGLSLQDNLKNFIQEETQMMISNEISASSDSAQWQSIDWKTVEARVLKRLCFLIRVQVQPRLIWIIVRRSLSF
ncbi:hypothetical protein THF1C08_1270001 [Vibrio jasicida]|uniref:Reverse transcriptase N-terminal domain-containing protein n=1 Tax=Vibrio jasicida TaxID=766224 RepID=A0AAU9QGV9_9VIBR|nr:hypothetical protein THF1C08_1270001 [Vibrio jasicida]CAH1575770.1 hypothetical protein THF1A12_1300001 [Vibrio jasicida]